MNNYGSDEANFEAAIVNWLLFRYGLENARARWMIQDQELAIQHKDDNKRLVIVDSQRRFDPAPLTLRGFLSLFPNFPVVLLTCCLSEQSQKSLTGAKLVTALDRTRLIREFDEALAIENSRRVHVSECKGDNRQMAVIFLWKYLKARDSVVVHNASPVMIDVPGGHTVWTRKNGQTLTLETLSVFMDGVDTRCDPDAWLNTAIEDGWDSEVSYRHRV